MHVTGVQQAKQIYDQAVPTHNQKKYKYHLFEPILMQLLDTPIIAPLPKDLCNYMRTLPPDQIQLFVQQTPSATQKNIGTQLMSRAPDWKACPIPLLENMLYQVATTGNEKEQQWALDHLTDALTHDGSQDLERFTSALQNPTLKNHLVSHLNKAMVPKGVIKWRHTSRTALIQAIKSLETLENIGHNGYKSGSNANPKTVR